MENMSDEKLHLSTDARALYFLNSDTLSRQLEKYDVEKLEQLAVELYENRYITGEEEKTDCIIEDILYERSCKLDKNFAWTDENLKELLRVNDLLMSSFEKAYDHADKIIDELEAKKKNKDFVMDYEVDIKLTPYLRGYEDCEGNGNGCFMFVLCEPLGKYHSITLSDYCKSKGNKKDSKYLAKSINWNEGDYFGCVDYFKDHYISYALHELLDDIWCFHDIIRINRVCTEVIVKHQAFMGEYPKW